MAVLELNQIIVGKSFENKNHLFCDVAKKALELGIIDNIEDFVNGLENREMEVSTCFEDGIAIPHCKDNSVKRAAIFIVKSKKDIVWDDNKNRANFVIVLAVPNGNNTTHIKLLSTVARKMVNKSFSDKVLALDNSTDIFTCFKDITG